MRLTGKLVVVFLALSTLPLTLIGYIAYVNGRATIEQMTERRLVAVSDAKRAALDYWVKQNQQGLGKLAQCPSLRTVAAQLMSGDPVAAANPGLAMSLRQEHLRSALQEDSNWIELFLLRLSDGMIAVSTDAAQEGKFRSNEPYFAAGQRATHVQNVYYSLTFEQAIMTIATPVTDAQGNLLAVLAGHLNWKDISTILEWGQMASSTEESYLVNRFNFVLTDRNIPVGQPQAKASYTAGVQDCLRQKDGIGTYQGDYGVMVIGAYQWIPEREMCLLTEIAQTEAFQPIHTLRNVVFGFGAIIIITVSSLAVFFARTITLPIARLVRGTEEIGQGRLDHRIMFQQRDELGQLAEAFNRMASQRQQAEEALRESEEKYRLAMEATSDGLWDWNIITEHVYYSPAWTRIIGVNTIDSNYQNWETRIHPEDHQGVLEGLQKHLSGKTEMWSMEHRLRTSDGGWKWVLGRGQVVKRDAEGRPIRMVGTMIDITDRKQAEEALRESEEKFKLLFNNAADAHVLYQGEQFIDCNQAALDMLGFHEKSKLLCLHPSQISPKFQPDGQDSLEKSEAMIARAFEQGSYRFEWLCQRADGSGLLLDVLLNVIRMKGHTLIHGVWQDITARKQAEELQQQHTRLLEEAVQQKQREMEALFDKLLRQEKLATIGQMAGSIAHELRNPLGAIRQSIYYLKHLSQRRGLTSDNPKVLRHLDLIDAELETSAQVITDLLDMTRAKPPQIQRIDLRPLLADTIARCHLPPQVRVTVLLEPEPFWIAADAAQLKQVLLNVLTNAAQAIESEGTITISASQSGESAESVMTIHDTGAGIVPASLEKVFEPLYTTKANGTGLGLPICKEIIEAHHGAIAVASQMNAGTTVTIRLPWNNEL